MKKRRLATLVAGVALIGAIGLGSTYAYFTDNTDGSSVVTTGNVNIELDGIYQTDENGTVLTDNNNNKLEKVISGLAPGRSVEYDPIIRVLEGSESAYIRCGVTFTTNIDDATETSSEEKKAEIKKMKEAFIAKFEVLKSKAWSHTAMEAMTDKNGKLAFQVVSYYKDPVTVGDGESVDVPLITGVIKLSDEAGNEWSSVVFDIDILAEAIQADLVEIGTTADGKPCWINANSKNIITFGDSNIAPEYTRGSVAE